VRMKNKQAVRMKNKVSGLLMETGIPYNHQKCIWKNISPSCCENRGGRCRSRCRSYYS
jgi:hypothetical protein